MNYVQRSEVLPGDDLMKLVIGYAGTGKTFTMGKLVKQFILMQHKAVALTAPTNKAVKVLKSSASYKHPLLVYKTIHSLLGLKMDVDDRGKQIFVQSRDPEDSPAIEEQNVLIIDESSMLDDDLADMIFPYVDGGDLKLIFMGDPVQIPPVNKTDSYPFQPAHRNRLHIGVYELSTVVRQAAGNPILELANIVRQHYKSPSIPYTYETKLVDEKGIIVLEKDDDRDLILQICEHYFSNIRFKDDSDFMKVIAWTNKVVDKMNTFIRRMIFKDQGALRKIMVGEKLIADKPIVEKGEGKIYDKILYTVNDEFEVDEYTVGDFNVFQEYKVKTYFTKVSHISEAGNRIRNEIRILHEQGEEQFNEVLTILKNRALKEKDSGQRRQNWRIYYEISNKFAWVKYNYAITAHKSQGSTYSNAMVIDTDIDNNSRIEERNRIRYVAYTRAKNLLFIVK